MFCQNCGKQIGDNTAFCPHCGAKNESVVQQPVAQPAAQPVVAQSVAQQPVYTQAPPVAQPAQPQFAQQQSFAPAYAPQPPVKKKSKAGIVLGIVFGAIALIVIIAIIGASGSNPEKKFYGTWTTEMELYDVIVENMDSVAKYMPEDASFKLKFVFTFNEDGTYTLVAEKDSYEAEMNAFKEPLKKAMLNYLRGEYSMYSDYSDEKLIAYFEDALGESLDSYLDEYLEETDYEAFSKEFNMEGKFKAQKDKLYLSDGLEYEVDEDVYAVYELRSDDDIIITDYLDNGVTNEDMFPLPCELKRAD